MKLTALLATGAIVAFVGAGAQQPVQPPAFRAGTDLVQVDVSVLDKHRKPVSGLTAADFTVFEDGKPRPIVAFTSVDLPEPVRPPVSWMRDVAPDVASNALPEEGRLVVILMDRSIPPGEPTMSARGIARAAIDELGPGDLAAVIYTGPGVPQNLTADRARLLKAIDTANPSMDLGQDANEIEAAQIAELLADTGIQLHPITNSGQCYCNLCVMAAVTNVADAVRDIPRRRKSLLFVGSDLTVQTSDVECSHRVKDARVAMFRATDLANLTVHAFDPNGLQTLAISAGSTVRGRGAPGAVAGNIQSTLVRQGNLGVLPDHTGGRTVLNTNEPGAEMRDVFRESHSGSASQPRNVEMLVTAFSPTARPLASGRQTAQVIVQPNARGEISYELFSRLSLRPGRYEIRMALEDTSAGQRGSVYTFVDVPNFAKTALSLSDVVVEARPGFPAAPSNAFVTMLPILPTARREFARSDRVQLFLRAYQTDGGTMAPVTVSARVRDDSNRVVFQQSLVMEAAEFGANHAVDYHLDLPVAELAVGEYVATIEASKGKLTAHRDVRFTIR